VDETLQDDRSQTTEFEFDLQKDSSHYIFRLLLIDELCSTPLPSFDDDWVYAAGILTYSLLRIRVVSEWYGVRRLREDAAVS